MKNLILILALGFAVSVNAASWYVDNSLTASANNGTSWANAWTNLSSITFQFDALGYANGSVAAGDTILMTNGFWDIRNYPATNYGRMLTVTAQTPPRLARARTPRPPCTNSVNLALGWSNSPSPFVVGSVLYWGVNAGTNDTIYSFNVTNGLENCVTVRLEYTNAPTHEGWRFGIKAFGGDGDFSDMSETIAWHIPYFDYSELIISGTPPFQWTGDLANWVPIQTIQSSFTWVNNGGARFFRSGGPTTIRPTIK